MAKLHYQEGNGKDGEVKIYELKFPTYGKLIDCNENLLVDDDKLDVTRIFSEYLLILQ